MQHLGAESSTAFLVNRLNSCTERACEVTEHMKPIELGKLYMAQADTQLLLKEKIMLVVRGPRENQFRPLIDTWFRSTAAYHGSKPVGVVLSGFMSAGVIGMECVKLKISVALHELLRHKEIVEAACWLFYRKHGKFERNSLTAGQSL